MASHADTESVRGATAMRAVNARYRYACQWIAWNDEPGDMSPVSVAQTVTVGLVADTFERTTMQVARAVIARRRKDGA